MFPFWEKVVAPMLEVAEVERIVEIGALRGENTRQILDTVGPKAELHVIDPVPDFDPEEHAKEFGGQYIFHRALSVDVLGDLEPMDAALIDGDHNWYTVYNECRLLAEVSTNAGAQLPLMIFHDVCWPYGRRDLYYNPDSIPAEFRQEWAEKGMIPGESELVPSGGLNPTMANAVTEGGPRNGVMTGVDDFVAEYPKPLRVIVLPIYFGLAIVVEEERLERQPELAKFLDHLDSNEGKDMLLELAESMRLTAMLFQHRIYFQNEAQKDSLARRYVDQIKRGLAKDLFRGEFIDAMGRFNQITDGLDAIRHDNVRGRFVSVGGEGAGGVVIRGYLDAHDIRGRDVVVVGAGDNGKVKDLFGSFFLLDDQVQIAEGDVASVAAVGGDPIAVLHVGRGADVQAALEALYPRLAPDAAIVVDGASGADVRGAIDAFRSAHGVTDPETATNGTASWRRGNSFKPGAASESSVKAAAAAGSGGSGGKLGSLLKRAKG
ncbi:MAG: hypothetical protein GX643_10570 [Acidimicrobiales bacterium]|nr:hypothetical protein [Acidimicrobiales bacterium]